MSKKQIPTRPGFFLLEQHVHGPAQHAFYAVTWYIQSIHRACCIFPDQYAGYLDSSSFNN